MISALAGTSRSTVSHFTISTGLPRRKPAIMNSSTSGGAGTMAEKVVAGSVPIATATSSREPFRFPSATCRRPQRLAIVLRCDLLPLPVHARCLPVVDLHAVHADIALARARVARMNAGQRDEAASVVRPALQNRKRIQVKIFFHDHFFAACFFRAHGFRKRTGQCAQ